MQLLASALAEFALGPSVKPEPLLASAEPSARELDQTQSNTPLLRSTLRQLAPRLDDASGARSRRVTELWRPLSRRNPPARHSGTGLVGAPRGDWIYPERLGPGFRVTN